MYTHTFKDLRKGHIFKWFLRYFTDFPKFAIILGYFRKIKTENLLKYLLHLKQVYIVFLPVFTMSWHQSTEKQWMALLSLRQYRDWVVYLHWKIGMCHIRNFRKKVVRIKQGILYTWKQKPIDFQCSEKNLIISNNMVLWFLFAKK